MAFLYYQTRQENQDLTRVNDRLRESLDTTRNILRKIVDEQKDVVSNPDVTVVNMVGTQVAPRSSANVYWDSAKSDVYLVVKNMPKLPLDQQYQLWALIDGKPERSRSFRCEGRWGHSENEEYPKSASLRYYYREKREEALPRHYRNCNRWERPCRPNDRRAEGASPWPMTTRRSGK